MTVKEIKPVDANNIDVTLVVEPDCRLGEHIAQVRTRAGISDFRSFFVGQFTEVEEVEPNSSIGEAQLVEWNRTVTGVVTNEDIDYFRIEGKKGQRLSVEIEAIRLGFMFDPAIALLDKNRFEVAVSDDTPLTKQDSFFSVVLPEDGEYFVTVRESAFQGNGNCRYRLHVGDFPRPVGVYPAGGKPGEKVTLNFIDAIRGPEGAVRTVTKEVQLPAEEGFRDGLFFEDEQGISPSPLPFRLSALENVLETEPNNTWVETPAIELPRAINGIIETEDDVDFFKFHSKQGQVWHINCFARRVGSGLDPVVNIYSADKKSVVGNDDVARPTATSGFKHPPTVIISFASRTTLAEASLISFIVWSFLPQPLS